MLYYIIFIAVKKMYTMIDVVFVICQLIPFYVLSLFASKVIDNMMYFSPVYTINTS